MKDAFLKVLHNPMFWVAVIYLLVPVDFLSDAVPVVGTMDDLIPFVIALVIQARRK